jgi:hypothetical protein
MGLTAIAPTPQDADACYDEAVAVLEHLEV